MPFQKNGVRQYDRELAWEKKSKPSRVKDRAARNKARAMVAKKEGVAPTAIRGDVGHRKAIGRGGKSTLGNLFIQDPGANRSFARKANGAMKNEISKRERKK